MNICKHIRQRFFSVYIIMKLVDILDLTEADFDTEALRRIPLNYKGLIFKDEVTNIEVMTTTTTTSTTTSTTSTTSQKPVLHWQDKRDTSSHRIRSSNLRNSAFFVYQRAVALATER